MDNEIVLQGFKDFEVRSVEGSLETRPQIVPARVTRRQDHDPESRKAGATNVNVTININNPVYQIIQNNSMSAIVGKYAIPSGALWRELRDKGTRKREHSSLVKLLGDICVKVPGCDELYTARAAEVFWDTPMEIDVLGFFGQQNSDIEQIFFGELDFHNRRRNIVNSFVEDPNITLYTDKGKIELNQVLGVPKFYVRNCKVKYHNEDG